MTFRFRLVATTCVSLGLALLLAPRFVASQGTSSVSSGSPTAVNARVNVSLRTAEMFFSSGLTLTF